jgi:hypothetical protein
VPDILVVVLLIGMVLGECGDTAGEGEGEGCGCECAKDGFGSHESSSAMGFRMGAGMLFLRISRLATALNSHRLC